MTSSPNSEWASRFYKKTVTENPYLSRFIERVWEGASPRQYVFLTFPSKEMMYGGAAGGGKSVALLAAALQFVMVPGYSALLLRRSFTDLNLPKALIPLSHLFLQGTDAKWDGQKYHWTFPSGAVLSFGYLATELDKYRYQGAEFQFIGFDELTQFTETQFGYLQSRLRKPTDMGVPLRIRAASNPGGTGHGWVKSRFIEPKTRGDRVFVPAKLEDNPHLDRESYESSLNALDPITRKQLRHGDWEVSADGGVFKRDWLRSYESADGFYQLKNRDGKTWAVKASDCRRFATLDVAGSEKTSADWSVLQLWHLTPSYDMLLIDQWRGQEQIPGVVEIAARKYWEWDCELIGIEKNGIGLAAFQTLRNRGLHAVALNARGDKVTRSQAAQIRMEAGMIHFPKSAPFLEGLIEEVVTFPVCAHDDQVDTLAWAAHVAHRMGGSPRHVASEVNIEQQAARQADAEETAKHPGTAIETPEKPPTEADPDVDEWLKNH